MKFCLFIVFLFISSVGFSQNSGGRRILFKGDSLWYAAENQMLFSSTMKGINWDTIFANRNQTDTVFFNGALDTATNVFISDQKTLFVFAWDGTRHYKTILYSSSDYGKTWVKISIQALHGVVGVNYFHKISPDKFFLDCRSGHYAMSDDAGKTWKTKCVMDGKYRCADERFIFHENGDITFVYSKGQKCKFRRMALSRDNGVTWSEIKL